MSERVSRRKSKRHGPVTPGNKGRFGDFDVLGEVSRWDPVTAGVVLARLDTDPQLSFFDATEEPTVRALLDLLLAQHDDPKVPVTELIDERLLAGMTDGWHYDDMPEDGEAWHRSLAALDEEARAVFGESFHRLSIEQQGNLVQAVQDGDEWHGFKTEHLWSLWTRYACTAFYSHPWAWNEMGFGGPAYPRGYKNMGMDSREEWERPETTLRTPCRGPSGEKPPKRSHAVRFPARPRRADTEDGQK